MNVSPQKKVTFCINLFSDATLIESTGREKTTEAKQFSRQQKYPAVFALVEKPSIPRPATEMSPL
jgi:hypothetical protein